MTMRRNQTMGDWEDLVTVSPIFLLMGTVLIAGYLAPFMMGKLDDWERKQTKKKNKRFVVSKTQWKCKCDTILINHGCHACNTLNDANVQTWCPDCLDHSQNPIAC